MLTILHHVLPNAKVPLLAHLPFILNGNITALDFLGFGLPIDSRSLGRMLSSAKVNLQAPWLGFFVFVTPEMLLPVLIFIREAVRDALCFAVVSYDAKKLLGPVAVLRSLKSDCSTKGGAQNARDKSCKAFQETGNDMSANTSEIAFNNSLADVLRGKHPLWDDLLGAEQTKVIVENPRLRPDILVRSPTSQPVAIETEFFPANTVESDARSRLGLTLRDSGEVIEQAIALRVPVALQHGQAGLQNRISQATFEYCLVLWNWNAPLRRLPRRALALSQGRRK